VASLLAVDMSDLDTVENFARATGFVLSMPVKMMRRI
jgi:hypothetical protein